MLAIATAMACGQDEDSSADGPTLQVSPQYVELGNTAEMELWFEDASDLGAQCVAWYTALEFGPGIGYEYHNKLGGCTGIRVRVIVGAAAVVGARQARLVLQRTDGTFDGVAEFWVVPSGT